MITAIILAVGGFACSEEENLRLNLFLVQKPGAVTPRCSQTASTTTRLATGTYTLRLSFMRRAQGTGAVSPHRLRKAYELVCDRIIKPGEALDFQVPANNAGGLIMRLEAFQRATPSSAFQLAYSGQMEGTDLGREDLSLLLRAADQLSCSDAMGTPRAFHSATLLPDGQVLILGGLVAESSGKSDKLHTNDTEVAYATGSAELYNPDTMQFTTLAKGLTTQRAFHKAVLLPSPPRGPYEVLVIGGVSPEANSSAAFRLKAGSTAYPFLVSPHEKAKAAAASLVTITPSPSGGAATLTDKPLTGLPKLMFPRVAIAPGGKQLVVAGGASAYMATGTSKGFTPAKAAVLIQLKSAAERNGKDPAVVAQTALSRTRVGHAIAPLGDNNYAVIGGTMDGPGPCGTTPPPPPCDSDWEKNNAGELITAGTGGASAKLMTFSGGVPEASGWHTLTPLGIKDGQTTAPKKVLLAGGFLLGREGDKLRSVNTRIPKTYPLMLLTEGAPVTVSAISYVPPNAFKGAGYHAAIPLADGSALLSGGNVNSNFITNAPCDKVTSPFCAYDQLSIYSLISSTATVRTTTVKKMSVARFGHQTTRLMDNAVLFTGGVTLRKEQNAAGQDIYPAVLLSFTEVYNPRLGGPAEDPFDRPAGKDYDTVKGMAAGTSTCGVQEE